jgi:hypothetical protein
MISDLCGRYSRHVARQAASYLACLYHFALALCAAPGLVRCPSLHPLRHYLSAAPALRSSIFTAAAAPREIALRAQHSSAFERALQPRIFVHFCAHLLTRNTPAPVYLRARITLSAPPGPVVHSDVVSLRRLRRCHRRRLCDTAAHSRSPPADVLWSRLGVPPRAVSRASSRPHVFLPLVSRPRSLPTYIYELDLQRVCTCCLAEVLLNSFVIALRHCFDSAPHCWVS